MTKQDALDYIREYQTVLTANPNNYEEDSICNLICALEDFVIPMLERDIEMDCLLEDIYDKNPHAFDRVYILSSSELKRALELHTDGSGGVK